ncbi:FHA domain-containing protein [Nocardia caishijiensis]|uniref:FHA domain-containing protein n=1 Tax=Nocardia caishijiensis TaxID=184756 RepID=A0ABQ6YGF6_9NOCA|nr:FHA domain-containing protein [Nocardia caishijiensis]KAF0844883.1 FHA domain-containing protein [Nocardia caishijiensis]
MAVCADGHQTQATDYCDVCGSALIGAAAPDPADLRLCPACSVPTSGRFCENCGYDSALPAPPPRTDSPAAASDTVGETGTVWVARVVADREFYDRVQARKGPDADRVAFPGFYPERRIELRGGEFLIGKRSASQGIVPEIDLGIAPADPGVSRAHALLRVGIDGALTVTDLGSTNGTSLDGSEASLSPQVPVPLRAGSRVHVGGWTTITIDTLS